MFLILWLFVWLIQGTPSVEFSGGDLNAWAISLIICGVLTLAFRD